MINARRNEFGGETWKSKASSELSRSLLCGSLLTLDNCAVLDQKWTWTGALLSRPKYISFVMGLPEVGTEREISFKHLIAHVVVVFDPEKRN